MGHDLDDREPFGEELDGIGGLERTTGLSRRLAVLDTVDEVLQAVVDLAIGYLEHCDGASLMFVGRNGEVATPASTDLDALASDEAQFRTGQGPCLSSMQTLDTVIVDDLAVEQRWPDWQAEVADLGWESMLGLRLFVNDDTMGALNLYSRRTNGFTGDSLKLGQVFAGHAAVAMKSAIGDAGLRRALQNRDVIGQAKGILMERERLTGEQAFERLRDMAVQRNIKVRDLARTITETGRLPD